MHHYFVTSLATELLFAYMAALCSECAHLNLVLASAKVFGWSARQTFSFWPLLCAGDDPKHFICMWKKNEHSRRCPLPALPLPFAVMKINFKRNTPKYYVLQLDAVFSSDFVLDVVVCSRIPCSSCCFIFVSLFFSLFAFMHAILRTIQAMAFDGPRAFKLFAKFEQNNLLLLLREIQLQQAKQQQQLHQLQTSSAPQRHSDEIDVQPQYHNHRQQQLPILGCLIFALLAGLMAALFALEQLMNLLSIGALLMFYTLTLDIILLRWIKSIKI